MEAMDDIIEIDDVRFSESPESVSDDSDDDPSYTALDEMSSKLSQLSVTKKSKRRVVEETDDVVEVDEAELGEVDEKSFEEVQRIVEAGKIEKLKVEQCKVYLRKNRLRLTGNKAMLIDRIKEHLEISNGRGEKKYPISSFVVNCKGDACTGDVVLFEQNVYGIYNIASRSASGPPCGTRMVAGRIVKESYGAAKQQHTFTVEVLWSKGEKALLPLHPLLIKGRNLFRLKTMRQKWEDEDDRRKKLVEKHARGSLARSNREARIEEKEKRKTLKANRVSRWEPNKNQPEFESTLVPKPSLQPQRSSSSDNSRNTDNQAIGPWRQSEIPSKPAITAHHTSLATNYGKPAAKHQPQKPSLCIYHDKVTKECQSKDSVQDKYIDQASQSFVGNRSFNTGDINQPPHPHYKESYYNPAGHIYQTTKFHRHPFIGTNNYSPTSPPRRQHPYGQSRQYYGSKYRPISPSRSQCSNKNYRPTSPSRRRYSNNNHSPASPSRRQFFVAQKPCHYYAQGRCHYGESCKYSHNAME